VAIKITEKQKMYVKRWLEGRDKESNCPFFPLGVPQGCNICKSYFPKIKRLDSFLTVVPSFYECPCSLYPLKTVIKRANEIVGGK
jgi:hypothetical protein